MARSYRTRRRKKDNIEKILEGLRGGLSNCKGRAQVSFAVAATSFSHSFCQANAKGRIGTLGLLYLARSLDVVFRFVGHSLMSRI